ncbi:MAG: hypothetical protein NMNS01_12110 [Nitrosomonas sp.]|nr:MAG: hypothetical protein NMNS01_12110 [Nitrosomonas sp.]
MNKKFMMITGALILLAGGGLLFAQSNPGVSAQTVEKQSTPAQTKLKTVKLEVPGMTCSTCPYTVKKILQRIDGVTEADAAFETMSATATFDPGKTSIDEMLEALKNQGYSSNVAEGECGADATTSEC